MAAKKKHNARHRKAKHNPLAKARRKRHYSHNPLLAGQTMGNTATLVGSAAAGLLGDVYIPAWLLGLLNRPDAGIWSYVVAAFAVILPTYIFSKINWPNVARGWLAGAGAGFVWRAIDDATGQKFVTIQSGVGAFSTQQQITLPGPNIFGQYARRALPAASVASVSTPVGRGMGYVKYPYAA